MITSISLSTDPTNVLRPLDNLKPHNPFYVYTIYFPVKGKPDELHPLSLETKLVIYNHQVRPCINELCYSAVYTNWYRQQSLASRFGCVAYPMTLYSQHFFENYKWLHTSLVRITTQCTLSQSMMTK